jgi:hypothetical protein
MRKNLQVVCSNLHEFADFLKKSLIINISILVFGFFSFITIYDSRNYEAILVFTILILILEIISLIFQGLMVHRVYRAKESDADVHLQKAFQFMIWAIIVGLISIFVRSGFFKVLLNGGQMMLNLSAWRSLTSYLHVRISHSESKPILISLKEGMKYYTNSIYASIGLLFFSWLVQLGKATGFLIFLGIIEIIIECFIIYSKLKLANAMLAIKIEHFTGDKLGRRPIKIEYQTFEQSNVVESFENPAYNSQFENIDINPTKYCPMCGSTNEKKAIFCIECGAKF